MGMADMGEVYYENIMDPTLLTKPDDPAVLGSSLAEIYPRDLLEGDFADAPQADATFNLDDFNFDFSQQTTCAVDSGFAKPNPPQSLFPDQRYVSLPQSQTHPTSVWRPVEQPVEQYLYPDPDFSSHTPTLSTPYYPPQPLSPATTMTQQNFRAITPPGQQFSSIDPPLFVDNCLDQPAAIAELYPELYPYETIPPYQDNGVFLPEDLALSPIPEELLATAIFEGWPLPPNNTAQKRSHPDVDLYIPNPRNNDSDADFSDAHFHPSRATKKVVRRTRLSRPHTILPNGEAKKGRPCAKPQTEERKRINERRMEGYYRRKYEQGNLEKARLQSKESYWRRKQRRIEAGEKVRSYNASNNNKQGGRKA